MSRFDDNFGKGRKDFGYGVDEALIIVGIVLGVLLGLGVWELCELVTWAVKAMVLK